MHVDEHDDIHTAIQEDRRRLERQVAGFVVVVLGLMTTWGWLRALTHDGVAVEPILIVLAVYFCGYAAWWTWLGQKTPAPWMRWLGTTVEISGLTLTTAIAAHQDLALALETVPVLVWALAIFGSAARMIPLLPLYAGLLAAMQWMSLFATANAKVALDGPLLTGGSAWQRFGLLLACGAMAEVLSTALTRYASRAARVRAERDRLRHAFGSYVADPVVERVLRGDDGLHVRTERRNATVLIVDIRNFTRTAHGQPADAVLARLNLALERFSRQVHRKRGIVNKFLGDGMLALFGAPMDDPHHVRHAYEAARAILVEADRLRLSNEYPDLQVGIGLASGEILVGDVGGAMQREYSAIGEVVNLAARLEQCTKDLGVPLLMDARVARPLDGLVPLRRLEPIRVRGVPGEVAVWTLDEEDIAQFRDEPTGGAWSGAWQSMAWATTPVPTQESEADEDPNTSLPPIRTGRRAP